MSSALAKSTSMKNNSPSSARKIDFYLCGSRYFILSANARSIIRRRPTVRQYAFPCTHTSVHARPSARVPAKRRDPKSKQTSPIAGAPWCPIEDSPQLTTTSDAACPFVAIERACLSLSLLRHWLSSFTDTPSCLSTPLSIFETEATRRPRSCPGVMRFYESKSGLRALDLFSDPLLFSSARRHRRASDSRKY